MGTSRIIFASGVFVIIGMYSLSFQTADKATSAVALAQAYHGQAEQIALAGAKFASVDLGSNPTPAVFPSSSVNLMGGNVSYQGDRPAGMPSSKMRITTVGTYGGHSITYIATVEFISPRWKVQRIYTAPDAAEISILN